MRISIAHDDYHWEDGDLATCSWKVLTTCTCFRDIDNRSVIKMIKIYALILEEFGQ